MKKYFKMILIVTMICLCLICMCHAEGINFNHIKQNEGLVLYVYPDPGNSDPILGYGHNLKYGIDKETAEFIFKRDIEKAQIILSIIFENYSSFTNNRKLGLTDMVFCMGENSFLSFDEMIAAVKNNNWQEASKECLDSHWAREHFRRAYKASQLLRDKTND